MPKPANTPRRLVTVMRQAINAHQAYSAQCQAFEPNSAYSAEGNAQRKRNWNAAAKADYERAQEQLREKLALGADTIRDAAAQHRPRIDANNPADLTRTAQAWQFTVLPRLEKGEAIDQIAATVGADALLGIERSLPTTSRANGVVQESVRSTSTPPRMYARSSTAGSPTSLRPTTGSVF